ncbi:MAG: Ku protein [Candidatus Binataceae bacterium]
MASRPISTGNISFGLVSIPVKLFSATRARSVSFHLLHGKDMSRIKQKIYCPVDDAIIDRAELVRGFEVEKGRYVPFNDEELKALESHDNHSIEITEFLPIKQVDPVYFEESYYLGCEAASAKAYRLLTDAMTASGRVALGRYTMRGKEHLVMIRPFDQGLMLHTMYYADEVRSGEDIDRGVNEAVKQTELTLAQRLIDELTQKKFDPAKYHDAYRERVLELAQKKVAGQEITESAPEPHRGGQVIDLMAALKASLDKRGVKQAQEETKSERASEAAAGLRSRQVTHERRRASGKK